MQLAHQPTTIFDGSIASICFPDILGSDFVERCLSLQLNVACTITKWLIVPTIENGEEPNIRVF